MSVEWSDDINTSLTVAHLLNLDLARVIENSLHSHGLHGPVVLELVDVLTAPDMASFVKWSDICGGLSEQTCSSLRLDTLLFTTAVLVLSSLVHKDENWSSSSTEHNLLCVHVDLLLINQSN